MQPEMSAFPSGLPFRLVKKAVKHGGVPILHKMAVLNISMHFFLVNTVYLNKIKIFVKNLDCQEILKFRTPKIIGIIFIEMEQFDFTIQ